MIAALLQAIMRALTALMQFLVTLALGIIAAFLLALPWLLRAASVLIWLFGAFIGVESIQTIYSPTTTSIPLFALQFAMILIMAAWALFAFFMESKGLWGILAAGGISAWACARGALWLNEHWKYASAFFGILPTAINITTYFNLILRARASRRQSTRIELHCSRQTVEQA
jgi:hypothetical protein